MYYVTRSITKSIIITIFRIHTSKFFSNIFKPLLEKQVFFLLIAVKYYNIRLRAILFRTGSTSTTLTLTCSLTFTTSAGSFIKRLAIWEI